VLVFYLMQTYLIFAGANTRGTRDAIVHPTADSELIQLKTKDGTPTVALFGKALTPDGQPRDDSAHRPTVIWFYGNAMCLNDCWDEFRHIRRLGANVMIVEYVGYGMAGGSPSEAGCYAAADAAYDHLISRPDIDKNKIVAAGWSLGAATAIDLASRRPVAGLATFSAFSNMQAMAHRLLPWFPSGLLLRHRFENTHKIATIDRPIFIAHGTSDSIIPPTMADELQAAAKGPVTRVKVSGADHNDLFQVGGPVLMRQFGDFLDRL
jgi:fermentation-respiration switch protein FrsA (DUF1100 family)